MHYAQQHVQRPVNGFGDFKANFIICRNLKCVGRHVEVVRVSGYHRLNLPVA